MALSFVTGAALAFYAGSSMLAPTSTRAPVVSMGPQVPSVGSFVYGAPVTLSSGYSRAGTPNSPCSFAPEITGKVVPTAAPTAASRPSSKMAGSFVYGPPVPLSRGVPGFSTPKHFVSN